MQKIRIIGFFFQNMLQLLSVGNGIGRHWNAEGTNKNHLQSGLIGTVSHRDMQKMRIIGFFFQK